MVELIEVVLDSMLTLVSPEKTTEKIKDINTSKPIKNLLMVEEFPLSKVFKFTLAN